MAGYLRDKDQNGFSFLELIFVLSTISVLLVLSLPLQISILENHREEYFFRTVLSDLLYLQNMAVTNASTCQIIFSDENYRLQIDKSIIKQRPYPPGIKKTASNLENIAFNQLGTIVQPGTIRLINDQSIYKIVCPFGKGRCYVVEET